METQFNRLRKRGSNAHEEHLRFLQTIAYDNCNQQRMAGSRVWQENSLTAGSELEFHLNLKNFDLSH